jgi:hypothetical protein
MPPADQRLLGSRANFAAIPPQTLDVRRRLSSTALAELGCVLVVTARSRRALMVEVCT